MRRLSVYLLSIFICYVSPAQGQTSSVPAARLTHIRHGINLSEWFAQVYDQKGYTKEHFQTCNTATDIALIKSAGFDHVRLSVNPQPMMDAGRRRGGSDEYFGYLDAAMKMILDAGLAVELDMHPDSDFKAKLAKEDDFVERFSDFWYTVARHYSSWDADRIFFEILNEPEMRDPYRWYGVEAKLAAAIRRGAPSNTIIAAGARWDDDDDLVFLEPLPDPNVVYVFHFYEPHLFTHQGATWSTYYWHLVKGLRYPSTPESAAQTAATLPFSVPISLPSTSRTVASEPASPSTNTLVESQTMARMPSSPSRRMASPTRSRASARRPARATRRQAWSRAGSPGPAPTRSRSTSKAKAASLATVTSARAR